MGIHPNCSRASNTVWLHNMDSKDTSAYKVKWEQHKDTEYCFKQILEAAA